ncbi:glycyl-radical enzyme activating protein [candidate division KSB1 bacterium]|nr:MAG: glycyl-radical enzyme activating protein [candidate division KSB1 bacterium]
MKKGIIFDIKRYAIHDGPGIRTTIFFKGCPLRCLWCHNPEGISPAPELAFWENKCNNCGKCIEVCPNNAISGSDKLILINREKCKMSGNCALVCPSGALEVIGKEVSIDDIMKEIEKDSLFYDESGGGVTFSGGEPLMQLEFLNALLEVCKERDIHTAVDTSGYAQSGTFEKILDKVDLFLYDVKIIDDEKHKKYTGVSNEIILKNLKLLARKKHRVNIRIPVIPGINDSKEDINKIVEFIISLKNVTEINLLPYHKGGTAKYKRLDKIDLMTEVKSPLNEKIEKIKTLLEKSGFNVKIGG